MVNCLDIFDIQKNAPLHQFMMKVKKIYKVELTCREENLKLKCTIIRSHRIVAMMIINEQARYLLEMTVGWQSFP